MHTTATRTAETIRIDGWLDEAAWQATTPLSRFVQREPVEGGEPSEKTEIRLLFTETTLYIGAICHDRSPREIIATQLSRDADLESRVVGLRSRFRWILQPGNDLFLTVNRGWRRTLDESRFEPVFNRASAKLQYAIRF